MKILHFRKSIRQFYLFLPLLLFSTGLTQGFHPDRLFLDVIPDTFITRIDSSLKTITLPYQFLIPRSEKIFQKLLFLQWVLLVFFHQTQLTTQLLDAILLSFCLSSRLLWDNVDIPKNLWEFLDLTVRSLYDSHQVSNFAENVVDKQRTIEISDCGISSTQFDLSPESGEYQRLYEAGFAAAEQFFGIKGIKIDK